LRLQKLALKVVLVLGFLLGVYVVDLVLDFIWPSSNIPDWILWGGAIGFVVLVILTERERGG